MIVENVRLNKGITPDEFIQAYPRFNYIKDTECLEVWDNVFDSFLCIDLKNNVVTQEGFNAMLSELLSEGVLVSV